MSKLEPQSYTAQLVSYQSHYFHGKWIHTLNDIKMLYAEVEQLFEENKVPKAEEFTIHAIELYGFNLNEHLSLKRVYTFHKFVSKLKADDTFRSSNEEVENEYQMLLSYHGKYSRELDFIKKNVYEKHEFIDEQLSYYIDWERIVRDCFTEFYFSARIRAGKETEVYIFDR